MTKPPAGSFLLYRTDRTPFYRSGTNIRKTFFTIVILSVVFGLWSPTVGQNLVGRASSGLFGIKAGLIGRMDLSTDPPLQSRIGSTGQVFAYFPLGQDYHLTAAFDFYYIQIVNSNQVMIEPNMGINHSFPMRRARMALVPGASIGFAFLADIGDIPASQYLSIKLSLEAHGIIDARKAWIAEVAVFHAPVGTIGANRLSFGPGVLLRLGLAFR